jgi:hypothetical protein
VAQEPLLQLPGLFFCTPSFPRDILNSDNKEESGHRPVMEKELPAG